MACKTSYELHHNFPKVAEESGFTFNIHRPRVHMDWNKMRLIDIDSLVRERKFIIIEQHINDILDCVLDSEFDVRILDEGVLKLFRLAQLTVEYQQFCRHYLDRSVYVLRQEISSIAQELDISKRKQQDKEEELRKLRKVTKHTQKYPLQYSNDNIATMILKSLSTKGVMFPTSSNVDNYQYNKCNYCEKVFLNQLYLQSHISRRHPNIMEIPQKETPNNENMILSAEITELKTKLKTMEAVIAESKNHNMQEITPESISKQIESSQNINKVMKDAEVSTNSENYFLDKIEEWKKVEREEYNREINKLRNQIVEIIQSFKQNENQHDTATDSKLIEQFHATITQQGAEIITLKKELESSKINIANDNSDKSSEIKAQIALWTKRVEDQSKQYEELLQKLNEVAKDAKESRILAMAESDRAMKLQSLLEQSVKNKTTESRNNSFDAVEPSRKISERPKVEHVSITKMPYRNHNLTKNISLENLHKKAQALLNISSLSSSSSDVSSIDKTKTKFLETEKIRKCNFRVHEAIESDLEDRPDEIKKQIHNRVAATHMRRKSKDKEKKELRKVKIDMEKRSTIGSPIKVIRAKLTEEVNNRLVAYGIDPLKYRLPQKVFQNHKTQLQQLRDIKAKENPAHERIRYLLLAYLDSSIASPKNEENRMHDLHVSPNKVTKPFRNIKSVISGVKSKALSLVKLKDNRKSIDTEVANSTLICLKSSPVSESESPQRKVIPNSNVNTSQKLFEDVDGSSGLPSNVGNTAKKLRKYINNERETTYMPYSTSDESVDYSDQNKKEIIAKKASKAVKNLIHSPARRPSSASINNKQSVNKYITDDGNNIIHTQSALNLNDIKTDTEITTKVITRNNDLFIKDVVSPYTDALNKVISDENIVTQTKGVLKNAQTTSNLNKKKVIFDMDAIQTKSLSPSNSQSITENMNSPHNYELGLSNLEDEEWDISSIENEPLKNDTKLQFSTNASPKIAELKQQIESQLARRIAPTTTGLVGAVDVLGLAVPVSKTANISGSNTSLGSSILDEPEILPIPKRKGHVKLKNTNRKEDSDMEVSDFSLDGIISNKNDTF